MPVLNLHIRDKQEEGKSKKKEVRLLSFLRILLRQCRTINNKWSAASLHLHWSANMSVNVKPFLHTTEF